MIKNYISLKNVNLHYSSLAFAERSLKSLISNFLSIKNKNKVNIKDVHALYNINLDIVSGERVGLLGCNGAGKTTLLKTIAGLYPISSGDCFVQGKIRSLFDLSLGFEPDATGRENILFRGLLLGQTPSTMREMEKEIVKFADIGNFIDYPIKTYSAGMLVRLAFAISTAVGGNILLLDEVIGAGDSSFMHKAKTRINKLIEDSQILVLASHDFGSLQALCQRGVVLDHGKIVFDGDIHEAIEFYSKSSGNV